MSEEKHGPPDAAKGGRRKKERTSGWRSLVAEPKVLLRNAGLSVAVVGFVAVVVVFTLYGPKSGTPQGTPDPKPSAIAESDRDSTVVTFATKVLTTWSTPDAPYGRWWSRLRPLLTPGGREAYAFTDPAEVPALGEVRATQMLRGSAGTTVTIYFETAKGRFGVDVSRSGPGAPWRANRVLFPGQESVFA